MNPKEKRPEMNQTSKKNHSGSGNPIKSLSNFTIKLQQNIYCRKPLAVKMLMV